MQSAVETRSGDAVTGPSGGDVGLRQARVRLRPSGWRVAEFTVEAGGAALCRVSALSVRGALLVWLGAAGGEPELGALALALGGHCTALGGGGAGEAAAGMARRLAAALRRPVHVATPLVLDRFTQPLVERALVMEIKSRPGFL